MFNNFQLTKLLLYVGIVILLVIAAINYLETGLPFNLTYFLLDIVLFSFMGFCLDAFIYYDDKKQK